MSYAVKEIYYTLQAEGANAGRPAVFCRFSGCNMWNGQEADRFGAVCRFCDTDFVGTDGPGGGWFPSARALAEAVAGTWQGIQVPGRRRFVVCTGGEPLLQLDDELVQELHAAGFAVAVETNGTLAPPVGLDWLCLSPKARAELVIREGDELKFVYPQAGVAPEEFEHLAFEHFFLQPMDGPHLKRNTELAVRYCLKRPLWRLSVQTHKLIGLREPGLRTSIRAGRLAVR